MPWMAWCRAGRSGRARSSRWPPSSRWPRRKAWRSSRVAAAARSIWDIRRRGSTSCSTCGRWIASWRTTRTTSPSASRRQLLPVDPPGVGSRTLGGLVATAASGPLRARYGTLRDLLLGVRFVQADGVVTWGGARVVKSVTGYDVPKLMVGALGSLGVLGELTLRLHPMPEFEATWLASFNGPAAAQA